MIKRSLDPPAVNSHRGDLISGDLMGRPFFLASAEQGNCHSDSDLTSSDDEESCGETGIDEGWRGSR